VVRHVSLHWLFGIAGSGNRSAIVCRNLQMNFPDLTASKCAMRFKDTQKVTGFRRTMLMNVAHKQHVVPLCNRSSAAPWRDAASACPGRKEAQAAGKPFPA
jgi:hypothetical protein